MTLFLLGVNHRTAGLERREALALTAAEVQAMLGGLTRPGVLGEALVLATCNRTEIYGAASEVTAAEAHVRDAVRRLRGSDLLAPGGHRYLRSGAAVAEHLFRVACGLDSMVLGDVQILGQVKDAYALARQVGSAGVLLDRLFETALHAGKRARGETSIGAGHVSMSSAAIDLAAARAGGLAGRRVLIIGAGDSARLAARHAAEHRPAALLIANRGLERAGRLAAEVGGEAVGFTQIAEVLRSVDVVVSATSAPGAVVSAAMVREAMADRPSQPLLLLDLAMPRDVEPAAAHVAGVTVRTLDTIQAVVDRSLAVRTASVPEVERIIEEETTRFTAWWRSLAATPTLVALREHFERIRLEEVDKLFRHVPAEERVRAERLTQLLVNRLLHVPMRQLKDADPSSSDGQLRLQAARELFALGTPAAEGLRRHDA